MKTKVASLGTLILVFFTQQALTQALASPPGSQARVPETYGTSVNSIYRMGVGEFSPIDSGTTYSDRFRPDGVDFSRYSTVPNGTFVAVPHLPGGALVTRLELDYCNTGVPDGVTLTLYQANFDGTSALIRGQVSTSAGIPCGSSIVDITPFTIDNLNGTVVLKATTAAGDATTSVSGAALYYRLQIGPPISQQFGDVPPSHPLYDYINALAASGITAGCGGGNYCPDSSLTRGQLAVFLAKALGLQWQ